jgi:hypothetical protein
MPAGDGARRVIEGEDMNDKLEALTQELITASKKIETGKNERLNDVWSQVAALQNLIAAASKLTGNLVIREQIQRQQDDLAALKSRG